MLEQITYLLFLRCLDELETLEENKSRQLGRAHERKIFPSGDDGKGRKYDNIRWRGLKNIVPQELFTKVSEHVFPFLRGAGGDNVESQINNRPRKSSFFKTLQEVHIQSSNPVALRSLIKERSFHEN